MDTNQVQALCKHFAFILYNLHVIVPHFIDEDNKHQKRVLLNITELDETTTKLQRPSSLITMRSMLSQF